MHLSNFWLFTGSLKVMAHGVAMKSVSVCCITDLRNTDT